MGLHEGNGELLGAPSTVVMRRPKKEGPTESQQPHRTKRETMELMRELQEMSPEPNKLSAPKTRERPTSLGILEVNKPSFETSVSIQPPVQRRINSPEIRDKRRKTSSDPTAYNSTFDIDILKNELNEIAEERERADSNESGMLGSKKKKYNWDVFRESTHLDDNSANEQCIERATQVLKVVTIILMFVVMVAGFCINKGLLLYVTSSIKQNITLICQTYVPDPMDLENAQYNLPPQTACVATNNRYSNDSSQLPPKIPTCIEYEDLRLDFEKTEKRPKLKGVKYVIEDEDYFQSQLCDIVKLRWIWCLLLMMCSPYFFMMTRNIYLICLKHEPNPRRDVFFVSLLMDSLYVFGICMLVFRILPQLHNVLHASALLSGLSIVPALLLMCNSPPSEYNLGRKVLTIFLNGLAAVVQISAVVVWPLLDELSIDDFEISDENTRMLYWVPVSLVLVSLGWWENYVDPSWGKADTAKDIQNWKNKHGLEREPTFLESMRDAKVKLSLLCNIWKITLTTTLVLLFNMKPIGRFEPHHLFSFLSNTDFCDPSTDNTIDNEELLHDASLSYDWLIVLAINIGVSMAIYFMGRSAAKIQIQPCTYAAAVVLSSPAVMGSLYFACDEWNKDACVFSDILPTHAYWACFGYKNFFVGDHGWMAVFWWISTCWVTRHIWFPKSERLARSKNIFIHPLVDMVVLEPWMLHNRRRHDEPVKTGTTIGKVTHAVSRHSSSKSTVSMGGPMRGMLVRDRGDSELWNEEDIPLVYMCATMWHESRNEMVQILKSIFRSDQDQLKRRLLQDEFHIKDPDYYEFEAHIFFDDAMKHNSQVTNHDCDEHGCKMNDFVAELVDVIDESASAVHEEPINVGAPDIYDTPYGGRFVWKLPGDNFIIAHLKDKERIRHKKRWSQVMYMYYLLGFGLWRRIKAWPDPQKRQRRADNTFLLALDGDVDFRPKAVRMLVDLMRKDEKVGAACGRIHPIGAGPMVWYQKFEYALGHWMQKATEHILGCVLCSPGCFSLFRASALMDEGVMNTYTKKSDLPEDHIQRDQGEDRWLCTLMLQAGHRVEYSAASDAFTYAPEYFNEFFNQRRRWMPSTMANIMDLLGSWKQTVKLNENISLLYIIYQAILLGASILGTGSIFMMIVGALDVVTKDAIGFYGSLMINLIPLVIFTVLCYTTTEKVQLFVAGFLGVFYILLQMLVLVGIIIQIGDEGITSPNGVFFFFCSGTFVLAAILHPQEAFCLVHGFIYFLSIPTMYMILMIYALTNMHVISWGTREVIQTETEKQEMAQQKKEAEFDKAKNKPASGILSFMGINSQTEGKDEGFTFAVGDLWKCICCPRKSTADENSQLKELVVEMRHLREEIGELKKPPASPLPGELPMVDRKTAKRVSFSAYDSVKDHDASVQDVIESQERDDTERSNIDLQQLVNQTKPIEKKKKTNEYPMWMYDPRMGKGTHNRIPRNERTFFKELIEKYLYPLKKDKIEEEKTNLALKEMRNKMSGTFFLLNAIFVTVVLVLQQHTDTLSIPWPFAKMEVPADPTGQDPTAGTKLEPLRLEPIGMMFLIFFCIIMVIQIIGMVAHRTTTFFHIIASTLLPCQSANDGSEAAKQHLERIIEEVNQSAKIPFDPSKKRPSGTQDTLSGLQDPCEVVVGKDAKVISGLYRQRLQTLKQELMRDKAPEEIVKSYHHGRRDTVTSLFSRRKSVTAFKFLKENCTSVSVSESGNTPPARKRSFSMVQDNEGKLQALRPPSSGHSSRRSSALVAVPELPSPARESVDFTNVHIGGVPVETPYGSGNARCTSILSEYGDVFNDTFSDEPADPGMNVTKTNMQRSQGRENLAYDDDDSDSEEDYEDLTKDYENPPGRARMGLSKENSPRDSRKTNKPKTNEPKTNETKTDETLTISTSLPYAESHL